MIRDCYTGVTRCYGRGQPSSEGYGSLHGVITIRLARIAFVVALVAGVSSPALAAKRIDLYDADGQYAGHAIVDRRAGRADYYDLRNHRKGWGRVNARSESLRVDLLRSDGQAGG